jgi:hypothetical protein
MMVSLMYLDRLSMLYRPKKEFSAFNSLSLNMMVYLLVRFRCSSLVFLRLKIKNLHEIRNFNRVNINK